MNKPHGGDALDGSVDRVRASKALSSLLRHNAEREGLSMDTAGYVRMTDVVGHRWLRGVDIETVLTIVRECPKQRFGICERAGELYIRANQGHSMGQVQAESLLSPLDEESAAEFATIIHGTFRHSLPSILRQGLSRMRRQHIHFCTSLAQHSGISGLRARANILISVNAVKAIQDGIPFFLSQNGVVLTPGKESSGMLPCEYFTAIYVVERDGSLNRFSDTELDAIARES